MPDIIQLLPDNIANQIAAGEVIQRPASAVKELLENAVDAGATDIQLLVQDAGKALVQVIDNGKGMSENDARMAFERHATSKIREVEDLFHIQTMGFRGEALASIAAVAQVSMKTKRAEDSMGTYIEIENSTVQRLEPCAAPQGTSISMKHLFFNVPARRNFLKSNTTELRNIIDEFIRVAMPFPSIRFSLSHNGQEMFHLETGSLKQRLVQLLGHNYNAKLVPVQEETDYLTIHGFIGKPDAARKTRGEQYFFVNKRFIKSNYLHHAVMTAFDNLLAKDSYPAYCLFIDLDPAQVDVNVHPTKQEIKFEDERIIYAFVHAAVKHALAQFSIAPSLDFTLNAEIQQLEAVSQPFTSDKKEAASGSSMYQHFTEKNRAHFIEPSVSNKELKSWKSFFEAAPNKEEAPAQFEFEQKAKSPKWILQTGSPLLQSLNTYIIALTNNGFILVHQQLAHERILYERYVQLAHKHQAPTQKSLFPVQMELPPSDAALLVELLPELTLIGFQIEPFGGNSFVVQGTPADVPTGNEKHSIELLLEQFKHFKSDTTFSKREQVIRCMARQQAVKAGQTLSQKEMLTLIEDLLNCDTANLTPSGNPTFISFNEGYIDGLFGR